MKKIYRKLSLQYIKKNKSRSLMMLIMIIVTVAFMISIDMIDISRAYDKAEVYKRTYGDYHCEYVDISKEKMQQVSKDKRVGYNDNVQNLGYLINNNNGTRVELKSFNGENDNSMKYFDRKGQILKGKIPKNNNEIIIDEISAKNLGIEGNPIGKKISFELRKSYTLPNGEEKLYSENKTFKVVGVVKRIYEGLNSNITGAEQERGLSYTYGDFNGQNIIPDEALTYDIIVRFNGNEERAGNFVEKVAMEYELGRISLNPNGNYLSALSKIKEKRELADTSSNNLVLILTIVLLVFNMLNIVWGEYLKEISMLRLIGARKRDIRFMVIYQSVLLAVIGTAIGVIVGIGITGIGVNILKDSTLEIAKVKPKIHIDSGVITKTIIISVISIALATIVPVIKIGRVGCMESISNSSKHKNKAKQSKIGKFIQDKFGIYRYMGVRNLWLKKTRTLISILVITLCGYLIIYTFSSMQDEADDNIRKIYHKYDLESSMSIGNDSETYKIPENKIEKIKNMDAVKFANVRFNGDATFIEDKNKINDYYIEYFGIDGSEKVEYQNHLRFFENSDIKNAVEPYMLDDKTTKDIEQKTNGYINVVVFNTFYDPVKTHYYHKIYKNLKVGDIITLGVKYHNGDKIEKRNVKVRVGAILKNDWQSYGEALQPSGLEIITSDDNMKELLGFKAYNNLILDYKDINNVEENRKVEKYIKKNIPASLSIKQEFYNMQNEYKEKNYREGFMNTTLVLMIAAISIFCTVKSNLIERRKEIFTMRALGMSAKDMNSMNMYEAVVYAILSIIGGIALGTYKVLNEVKWYNDAYKAEGIEHFMDFTFPYPQAIIFAVVTLATCIIAVKLANRDFKNKEISDGMRDLD